MNQEDEPARRKRRTKHRRKELTRLQLFLRGRGLAYGIFAVMLVVTGVYAFIVASPLLGARERLGLVRIGMTQSEVHYALGKPSAQDGAGRVWTYGKEGRIEEYRFDAAGRVEMIGCSVPHEAVEMCPATLGLGVGSNEAAITRRLGPADRATFAGTLKRLNYDGLGLEFDVTGGQVRSLRLFKSDDNGGMMRQVAWVLLP